MKNNQEKLKPFLQKYGVSILSHFEHLKRTQVEVISNHWIFFLIKNGSVHIEIDEKKYVAQQGDLIFLTFNRICSNIQESPDFQGAVMLLDYSNMGDLLPNRKDVMNNLFYVIENPIIKLSNEAKYLCAKYFELINYRLQNEASNYNREIIHSIIGAVLYEWMGHISKISQTGVESRNLKQGEILFKKFLIELMSDNIRSRSVTDYANRLCVTPKYLSAVCKQTNGKTASDYINYFIVKDIKHLLLHSEKSIKEISQMLGFPNLSFFGKYVKAHLGMSPSVYRKIKLLED